MATGFTNHTRARHLPQHFSCAHPTNSGSVCVCAPADARARARATPSQWSRCIRSCCSHKPREERNTQKERGPANRRAAAAPESHESGRVGVTAGWWCWVSVFFFCVCALSLTCPLLLLPLTLLLCCCGCHQQSPARKTTE